MADTKLSALTALSAAPASTDELYVNDGGTSKKVQSQYLMDYISPGYIRQSFYIRLHNNSGTLRHFISTASAPLNVVDPDYASMINGATATYNNTPTGTDSSTAFVAGLKISTTNTHNLILDTADFSGVDTDFNLTATISDQSTGTHLAPSIQIVSHNVNGTTRVRAVVAFYQLPDRTLFVLNTTNIASGKQLCFKIDGYAPVYA
tara:strand:- start:20101 stop:20715 length:615 start_codon:yes stop_codon:yes gene_type:complete